MFNFFNSNLLFFQSYLNVSHSSLRSDSLGLDLSGTAQSLGGLGTGREENINYMLDLSDDNEDTTVINFVIYFKITFYVLW